MKYVAIGAAFTFASALELHAQRGQEVIELERRPAAQFTEIAKAPPCTPASADLRTMARDLFAKHGDSIDFYRAMDRWIGVDTADMNRSGAAFFIAQTDAITIMLQSPYFVFRYGFSEAIRKREPIDRIALPAGVVVSVTPTRIDAPDIIKVILERDGKEIAPLASSLTPTAMTTMLGAKATLHKGMLIYPCPAFLPDARVVLTAIPESGSNSVRSFTPSELAILSAARDRMATSLLGLAATEVRQRLGAPTAVDGKRWGYLVEGGRLNVYLGDGDLVTSVDPPTFYLGSIRAQK